MTRHRAEPFHIGKELQIARVAGRQERVITASQLHEIGLTDRAICARVNAGRLVRVHRGVYAVGPGDLTVNGRFLAAVLAVGDDAFLCDVSAAHLWGFWPYLKHEEAVHVTLARQVRSRRGIVVHSVTAIEPRDTSLRAGIPVVMPARALLEMARTLKSHKALRRAVHEAEVQKRVSQHQLRRQIERNAGTKAAKRLTALIAHGPTPTRSTDEDDVVEMIRRNKLPHHTTNTRIPGLPAWIEVDIFFPDHGFVIEVDSAFHDTDIRRADDARKQAIIEAHGLRLMRLRKADASSANESATVARIARELGRAA